MKDDFQAVFERLKLILAPYAPRLLLRADTRGNYSLDTPYLERFKKEVFFGAVQIKKNYVSFHIMLVYIFPDLLNGMSPALKKRMQGKSCFNFTSINEELMVELEELTRRGVERFKETGLNFNKSVD
jgi:hypothetical protein